MIEWREVTETEPRPGHRGYVLLCPALPDTFDPHEAYVFDKHDSWRESEIVAGWRLSNGDFVWPVAEPSGRPPTYWAPLNPPGSVPASEKLPEPFSSEFGDIRLDTLSLHKRIAALEEQLKARTQSLDGGGWLVTDIEVVSAKERNTCYLSWHGWRLDPSDPTVFWFETEAGAQEALAAVEHMGYNSPHLDVVQLAKRVPNNKQKEEKI